MSLYQACEKRLVDLLVIVIFLLLSCLLSLMAVSYGGNSVFVTNDASAYLAMVMKSDSPSLFLHDFAYSENVGYATLLSYLLSFFAQKQNYILAFYQGIFPQLLLFFTGFYIFGLCFFKSRKYALLLVFLLALDYSVSAYKTYIGIIRFEPLPRTLFYSFIGFILFGLFSIKQYKYFTLIFIVSGILLIFVHPMSGLALLAISYVYMLLFLFMHRRTIALKNIIFSSIGNALISILFCCLLIVITHFGSVSILSPDDKKLLSDVFAIRYPYHVDYLNNFFGTFREHTLLLTVAFIAGAVALYKGEREKKPLLLFSLSLCIAPILIALVYILYRCICDALHLPPQLFDLGRGVRFLFMGAIILFLSSIYSLKLSKFTAFILLVMFTAICINSAYFTNSIFKKYKDYAWNLHINVKNEREYYAKELCRALPEDAGETSIFSPVKRSMGDMVFIRYYCGKSLSYSFVDSSFLFYKKNITQLKYWKSIYEMLEQGKLLQAFAFSKSKYMVIDKAIYKDFSEIADVHLEKIFSNERFVLYTEKKP